MGLVLITAAWNAVRLWTAFAWRIPLETYAPSPGAWYVALSGMAAAILGAGILWGLWRRTSWAPAALLIGAWAYVAWTWTDRLVLQSQQPSNWPFTAVITALLLGWTTAIALDKRNEAYFGKEAHGREPASHTSE